MGRFTEDQLHASMERARIRWQEFKSSGSRKRNMVQTDALDHALTVLAELEHPMTVRGVYYRAESFGAVSKDDAGYETVKNALTKLRKVGKIPYGHIVDGSRGVEQQPFWDDPAAAIDSMRRQYRRSVWADQDVRIWLGTEKDAIVGVIREPLDDYTVPFAVMRGYASLSLAWEVHSRISRSFPTVFLQCGDHDPSGEDAWRDFRKTLSELLDSNGGDSSLVSFERIAVTPDQIRGFGLHTRPTKLADSRAKKWQAKELEEGRSGESVEVDAIPPRNLRRIVREKIEQYVDMDAYQRTRLRESFDIERLQEIADDEAVA